MAKTEEEYLRDYSRGQIARLVHSEISEIVHAREMTTINGLVSYYTSGKLTWEMALGAIAGIAAMRGLISKLDSEIKESLKPRNETMAKAEERYS